MPSIQRLTMFMSCAALVPLAGLAPAGLVAQTPAAPSPAVDAHDTEAKALLETRCHSCHTLETVTNQSLPEEQWREIVERMTMNGAVLSEPESESIISYLAKAHGPQGGGAPGNVAHP